MSTTRCMMKATSIPQNFWAEAVRHAIYILNSVPTKALEDINPYEAIRQRKPNLETLRVFGCIAYAKVPSQHLTKLDNRSVKMVYLGNEQGSKAYRLFDLITQRICVSRDVKFKENETWDWKDYTSEHTDDEPEWTDFKIGNLKVTNEHHDHEIKPQEEDYEFPNNDDDDNSLKSLDFKKCALEQAIYTKKTKDSILLIGVYVDDLIITGTPKREIDKFKAQMEEKIEMSDLGILAYYLGIEVTQTNGDISIKQSAYASQILKEARMIDLLRYVKGTKDHGITYKHNGGNKIHGYSDSSYRVNTQEGKGTTGIIFYYGESPINWSTQKQATIGLSSCESEFIAATAAATQALWLKRLLSKLTHTQEEKITIQVDNKSAIKLMKNPVFHERSKHIDTKYHFIRECIEREDLQVKFIRPRSTTALRGTRNGACISLIIFYNISSPQSSSDLPKAAGVNNFGAKQNFDSDVFQRYAELCAHNATRTFSDNLSDIVRGNSLTNSQHVYNEAAGSVFVPTQEVLTKELKRDEKKRQRILQTLQKELY
nr:ribonuclease H-like domain, reverse transcriptase, RNA-dependent DNA polymerase [Tanacetum cinerariifolium]